jgi:pyridoxine/pyridoxamine 5'-phosphate oxidase
MNPIPEVVQRLYAEMTAKEPYPAVALATVDPDRGARARTVIVRTMDFAQRTMLFYCHRQHDKWHQLKEPGEICLWGGDRTEPLQLRFRCRLQVLDNDVDRQLWWTRVPPQSKVRLYATPAQQEQPPDDFLPLLARLGDIDLLDGRVPHRFGFVLEGDGYRREERLV